MMRGQLHGSVNLKRGTVGYVCVAPQPATVGLPNREADRKTFPAVDLVVEEGVEQAVPGISAELPGSPQSVTIHYTCCVRPGGSG